MNPLAGLFSSKVRAEIIKTLFLTNKEFYLRELQRETGMGFSSVQRDIKELVDLDFVTKRQDGNRVYFKANENHPLSKHLKAIVDETFGALTFLKKAFEGREDIGLAFVFGSFSKGKIHGESDIDLMVIGDISMMDLVGITHEAQKLTPFEINPIIFSEEDIVSRLNKNDHFINEIKNTKKTLIKGDISELRGIFKA